MGIVVRLGHPTSWWGGCGLSRRRGSGLGYLRLTGETAPSAAAGADCAAGRASATRAAGLTEPFPGAPKRGGFWGSFWGAALGVSSAIGGRAFPCGTSPRDWLRSANLIGDLGQRPGRASGWCAGDERAATCELITRHCSRRRRAPAGSSVQCPALHRKKTRRGSLGCFLASAPWPRPRSKARAPGHPDACTQQGLEFPCGLPVGWSGLFPATASLEVPPSWRTRLCYVGINRARAACSSPRREGRPSGAACAARCPVGCFSELRPG